MGNRRDYLIQEIVKFSLRLDHRGFGANHDGNISAKLEDNILATPTAVCKGLVTPEMILTLDSEGNKIAGVGKPFSEIKLHLAAYQARPDIAAVVHAHPPFATARGLTGEALRPQLPEAIVSLGAFVPVAPFAMPGSRESEATVIGALSEVDVFMMPGNGVLAVGTDIEQAYLRLELVEHLVKIDFYARGAGKPMELSEEQVAELLKKRPVRTTAHGEPVVSVHGEPRRTMSTGDSLRDLIAAELKKALQEESNG